jgi:hypothetical protein
MANDGGGGSAGAVEPTGTRRRQPLDEFYLPDGTHGHGTVRAVHRARLEEHRRPDIVPAGDVGMQLVKEIALVGQTLQPSVPKMVMGVADRELGFERRFLS